MLDSGKIEGPNGPGFENPAFSGLLNSDNTRELELRIEALEKRLVQLETFLKVLEERNV